MNIETIIETIRCNNQINSKALEAIIAIISNILNKGYTINLVNLNNHLAKLSVVEGDLDNQAIVYLNNKIIIDPSQVKFYDHNLAFTMIIIEMLRVNSDIGMLTEPISKGFNESFAISLMGIDGLAIYEEEQVICRLLSKIIGDDVMINIFFMGNMLNDLIDSLIKVGCSEEETINLIKLIKENYDTRMK
ncbi:MAG: hypothetical protein RR703_00480 [Bacilli bacterium]